MNMEELYEIIYGKVDPPLYVPVGTLGKLSADQIFKIPNLYQTKDLTTSDNSFKVIQISQSQQKNGKLVTSVTVQVIKSKKEDEKKICYVCGDDLSEFFKTDLKKQDGLNAAPPVVPQMILWNGKKEMVCPDCYKAAVTGLKVFRENNPKWNPPK
jgi:hypothetical protein